MNFERQYAQALKTLIQTGVKCENRTGIDTIKLPIFTFHAPNVLFDLPILKGKKIYPKMSLKEICWMMSGNTDVSWLNERGVNYWNAWTDDKGTIGKSYGHQFRNFNGFDNLHNLLIDLINNPMSRRLILNLWNPNDLKEMTLPPCVYDYQLDCTELKTNDSKQTYKVNLLVTQRSSDAFLGVPYDMCGDVWFLVILCLVASYLSNKLFIPVDVFHTCKNFHLYINHLEQAKQYLANVEENKNGIIDKKKSLIIDNVFNFYSIDNYLKMIDDLKYSNFTIKQDFNDEYGVIKADVAI